MFTPSTRQEFVATLSALADSREFRTARGAAIQGAVLAGHSPEAWSETASAIYAKARTTTTPVVTGPTPWQDGQLDRMVAMIQHQTGFSGLEAAAADAVTLRGPGERIRHWSALRKSQRLGLLRLLPEWIRARISDARRRVSSPA
jgi:hypothetical protein